MSMKVMKKNKSRKEFGCDLDRDMVSDKVETVPDWQTMNHLAYIALRRKTFCVGSSCWLKPPMPKFCVAYTNMLVSKNIKICASPNTKHEICVTPKAKPQCKPMEYRLRWLLNAKFSLWPCTFHDVCAHFICVGHPTRTQFAVEYGLLSFPSVGEDIQNIEHVKYCLPAIKPFICWLLYNRIHCFCVIGH